MNRFENISEKNSEGNFILSNFKRFEQKAYSDGPSVKMVLSGNEHYWVNGHHYNLGLDRYLIVDNKNLLEINIEANEDVKGICIYPNKDLLNEVVKTRISTHESLLDTPFDNNEINLVHNKFNFRETRTGRFLKQNVYLIIQLQKRNEVIDFEDFYIRLSECIIDDQLELEGNLKNVSSVKKATKEELYRRVTNAKNYVEDNFTQKISLDNLAQEAFLSKYHFTRTFKALFNLSPYQYLLELRLKRAKELLSFDYSYNEVSDLVGFSDGKNLRKALKKLSTE